MKRFVLTIVLLLASPALACPTCVDTVASDEPAVGGVDRSASFNGAIWLMVAAAALAATGVAASLRRAD